MTIQEKKRIGLLVAVEMDSVFARYGTPGKTEHRGGFDVFHYENEQYILYVIHSGIGEIAAAAAAQLLIDRYEVELIVNFGVVGGLTDEMALVSRICGYLSPGRYGTGGKGPGGLPGAEAGDLRLRGQVRREPGRQRTAAPAVRRGHLRDGERGGAADLPAL